MSILTALIQGAAQSLTNVAAQQSGASSTKTKRKTGCSPCAARAQQAAIQQKLGVKGWYKR